MLFNSLTFAIFLPIVFGLYWIIGSQKAKLQNLLLLLASYYFYACWDWRFLFLLMFSTLLDYTSGILMENSSSSIKRRIYFWISIIINLGFLGVFKYFNFFSESFTAALLRLGIHVSPFIIDIILPVGISFYTFHGISYVIDIYKRKISAEKDIVDYSLFVSYFPLLVAGPIERATHLLPQIKSKREFDYTKAINGLKQILWGLFKKVVIADNCAVIVNQIFDDPSIHSGSTLALGAILFAFQIYGDFSGYSDIALGTSKLFGIDLLRNFSFPYFSRDIAEFWRRWHISLSSWFRDYLYFPLGGSRGTMVMTIRNTFIIFLVSGFWHGANWTFIVWGGLHALFFIPLLLLKRNRQHIEIVAHNRMLPTIKEFISIISTFILVTIAWIFFRADSVSHALEYISGMLSSSLFSLPAIRPKGTLFWLIIFLIIEWMGRRGAFAIDDNGYNMSRILKYSLYIFIIYSIILCGGQQQDFIYFQF